MLPYADYDYERLLVFLHQSEYIPPIPALAICQERSMYPEMVYLYGRMGERTTVEQLRESAVGF